MDPTIGPLLANTIVNLPTDTPVKLPVPTSTFTPLLESTYTVDTATHADSTAIEEPSTPTEVESTTSTMPAASHPSEENPIPSKWDSDYNDTSPPISPHVVVGNASTSLQSLQAIIRLQTPPLQRQSHFPKSTTKTLDPLPL